MFRTGRGGTPDRGADAVAASFVQRAADVQRLVDALGPDRPQVVAKIETASVVARAEREADYPQWGAKLGRLRRSVPLPTTAKITDATSEGAWRAASNVGAAAIVCCTPSGDTARAVARFRPTVPVVAVSPSERTVRALSLTWGVTAVRGHSWSTTDDMVWLATEAAVAAGMAGTGDVVVVIGGYPGDPDPAADVLRVARLR
jgi:pyruvate kinase